MSEKADQTPKHRNMGYQPKPKRHDTVEFPNTGKAGYQPTTEPKDVQPPSDGTGIEPPEPPK